jgi:hypothetical protein
MGICIDMYIYISLMHSRGVFVRNKNVCKGTYINAIL